MFFWVCAMSSTNGYINDDVWSLIKSYLFHGKFEAIDLIKYHVELPYALGMHNHKGVEHTYSYLWDKHSHIFELLSVKQVRNIIEQHIAVVSTAYS